MSIDVSTGNSEGASLYKRACHALGKSLEQCVPSVERDPAGYVLDLERNLLPGITRNEIETEFGSGAGMELDGKMRAPWSSSALAVNSFAPWRRSLDRFHLAGMTGFTKLSFEAKCPNGVSAIPPHLDVLLEGGGEIVGVESKCLEYLKPKDHVKVSPSYLQLAERGDSRSRTKWFEALRRAADFKYLDAYQLVKHYLGLALTHRGRRLSLVYIFWEPCNAVADPVFRDHLDELNAFTDIVKGDSTCRFLQLSYLEHWLEIGELRDLPPWLRGHVAELRKRYAVAI